MSNQPLTLTLSKALIGAEINHALTKPGNAAGQARSNAAYKNKPQSYIEGYTTGKNETENNLRTKIDSAMNALIKTTRDLQNHFNQELKALEPQIVDLALGIAKSIVKKEIEGSSYDIQKIVDDALQKMNRNDEHIKVHLNPVDIQSMGKTQAAPNIEFVADPAVPQASCSIETSYGFLVRDVDELLQEIAATLNQSKPEKSV